MHQFSRSYTTVLTQSLANAEAFPVPYRHWVMSNLLPESALAQLQSLPIPAPDNGGVSGRREVHNATRRYFDAEAFQNFPVTMEVASFLQASDTVASLSQAFGVDLEGTYLRLEYAQDIDGFWLEPHTDLGVKRFTLLLYLSDGEGHDTLGTDIYSDAITHVGRSPFAPNKAMVFVPADNTWHGFEKRPIKGVRRSLILNYVTSEWRAREQLAFPQNPVTTANVIAAAH